MTRFVSGGALRLLLIVGLVSGLVTFFACDDGEPTDGDGDADADTDADGDSDGDADGDAELGVEISSPAPDGVVGGDAAEIEVTTQGPAGAVELLAGTDVVAHADVTGDGPHTLTWDTTATADGAVDLTARVTEAGGDGTATSDVVSVVVDNTAPTVTLDIERLLVVLDTVPVPVTIEEANVATIALISVKHVDDSVEETELMSHDGAATELSWNSTEAESKVHWLIIRVTDGGGNTADSEEVPVVVLNDGLEVPRPSFSPGSYAYVPEPFNPNEEFHTQMSIPMDARPVRRFITWLTWDEPGWALELAVGQGVCPHNGRQYTAVESDTGELILDISPADLDEQDVAWIQSHVPDFTADSEVFPYNGETRTCGAFFGHIAPLEPTEHIGDELPLNWHGAVVFAE